MKRSAPTNCQIEPEYPEHETVHWSFRDPDWVSHSKMPRCPIECPHKIEQCGEFDLPRHQFSTKV